MAWLCTVLTPFAPHGEAMATAAFAALVVIALVHWLVVLPAVYAYQRKVYGPRAVYNLHWISSADLREAGLGWAVWFQRLAIGAIMALFAPVALWPSLCS